MGLTETGEEMRRFHIYKNGDLHAAGVEFADGAVAIQLSDTRFVNVCDPVGGETFLKLAGVAGVTIDWLDR